MPVEAYRESVVEKYLVKKVKSHESGFTRKVEWAGVRNAPDRLVCLPEWGISMLVELKRPGKKATAAQSREHARLIASGLTVVVFSSISQVDEYFTYLEQKYGRV